MWNWKRFFSSCFRRYFRPTITNLRSAPSWPWLMIIHRVPLPRVRCRKHSFDFGPLNPKYLHGKLGQLDVQRRKRKPVGRRIERVRDGPMQFRRVEKSGFGHAGRHVEGIYRDRLGLRLGGLVISRDLDRHSRRLEATRIISHTSNSK